MLSSFLSGKSQLSLFLSYFELVSELHPRLFNKKRRSRMAAKDNDNLRMRKN